MRIGLGEGTTFPGTFPAGTVVTLSENVDNIFPAPDGYTWGEPVFVIGGEQGQETNTFTVEDQKVTAVMELYGEFCRFSFCGAVLRVKKIFGHTV